MLLMVDSPNNILLLFADPQKQFADIVIQVLPTQLIPDDNEGKVLRVRMIMKEGVPLFEPTYLYDEGSTISWIPCGRKLTCSYPGIKFFYGPDTYYGKEVKCRHEPLGFVGRQSLIEWEILVRGRCRLWRWTDSLTSWKSLSMWRAT